MVRTSVPVLFAALTLGACTVTVYDSPGARPAPPSVPAAAPAPALRPAQPAVVMRPAFGNPPVTRPIPPPPPLARGGATALPGVAPNANVATPAIAPPVSRPIAFGNGNAGAFRGLAYVLAPDTKRIPELSQMTPFATVFTDSFQIRPQPFSGGFPGALMQEDWFAIRYEGLFNVPADGSYMFKLLADHGAALTIDGALVLDDQPGGPGTQLTQGFVAQSTTSLKAGTHRLRLDYFQGAKGNVALELFMDPARSGSQAATALVGLTPAGAANAAGGAVPAGR